MFKIFISRVAALRSGKMGWGYLEGGPKILGPSKEAM